MRVAYINKVSLNISNRDTTVSPFKVELHLFYHQQTHPMKMSLKWNEFIVMNKMRPGDQVGSADPIVCPRPGQTPVCPWNDQDMVRGWSPGVTMQELWAESPSFITSFTKESAPISGSSEHKNMIVRQYINCSLLSAEWLDCRTNFLLNKYNA